MALSTDVSYLTLEATRLCIGQRSTGIQIPFNSFATTATAPKPAAPVRTRRYAIPEWFTTFHPSFARPGMSREALITLREFAKVISIPTAATWRVYSRGVGLIVTAKWRYSDPGAVPATEVDNIGGIPVKVEDKING